MRFALLLCLAAALVLAADKKKTSGEAGNDNLDITAKPLILPDQIRAALESDLPPGIIAVEVTLIPRGESALSINRDDFILLSRKDGQRSGPYSPSQIAGSATMVVTSRARGGGEIGSRGDGPVWGGIPGTGGRPRQVNDGSGGFGSTASHETDTKAEIKDDQRNKSNPLLKVLEAKILPDKEITEPLTGLLYFPIEGKIRQKDLALIYKGPAGRLIVEFN
jgi:hypothetical protein